MELSPFMWTRYAFRTNTHCDLQFHNMCEAFNIAILEYKGNHVITFL